MTEKKDYVLIAVIIFNVINIKNIYIIIITANLTHNFLHFALSG